MNLVWHEKKVVSAHRTPDLMFKHEEARGRGIKVIIAGAGGAHLPGMVTANNTSVISVPVKSRALSERFSLFNRSMPGGVPVATMAFGEIELKCSFDSSSYFGD